MIASTKKSPQSAYAPDDERFLEMIPAIQRYARSAFRNLRSQVREEAVCAVVADVFFAFRRLVELGKQDRAYATPLARFAVRRYWAGRCAGMTRGRDLTSPKARTTHGIIIERLDKLDNQTRNWRQALVEDRRATPADIAARGSTWQPGFVRSPNATAGLPRPWRWGILPVKLRGDSESPGHGSANCGGNSRPAGRLFKGQAGRSCTRRSRIS